MKTYLSLLSLFGGLSLLSIGGGNTVLPEMHLRAVSGYHWLTDSQFADIFSISQAAPGPSILIVSLVGYAAGVKVAGVLGGLAGGVLATVAMIVPANPRIEAPTNTERLTWVAPGMIRHMVIALRNCSSPIHFRRSTTTSRDQADSPPPNEASAM